MEAPPGVNTVTTNAPGASSTTASSHYSQYPGNYYSYAQARPPQPPVQPPSYQYYNATVPQQPR
jgi:hypothetical protein